MVCNNCEKDTGKKITVVFPNKTCICQDCVILCMEIVGEKLMAEMNEIEEDE